MRDENLNNLHQTVVDASDKVNLIIRNQENQEVERLTLGEELADKIFEIGSSWISIALFASIIIIWVSFNILVSPTYVFDRFPFYLMTFLLVGTAAIQAPIIMISQHRQNQKNCRRIAENLKIDNEILSHHRSIVILMEQQIQQVLANQMTTIRLLQEQ